MILASRNHRATSTELLVGLPALAGLLETGLSLGRVLDTFATLAPPRWQPHLLDISARVRNGASLTTAFSESTLIFPPTVVGLLRAGEERGAVATAAREAAMHCEAEADVRESLRRALTYPVVLLVSGVSVLLLMSTVVIPKFALMLRDLGVELPRATRVVLALGRVVEDWGATLVVVGVALVVGASIMIRSSRHRSRWHALLLEIPFLGDVRMSAATIRLARTLASLLSSGIPLARALDVAARSVGDDAMAVRLLQARQEIVAGAAAAAALRSCRAVSPTAIRLIAAGESTGRLSEMLRHAATVEQRELSRRVGTAVRLLEPALVIGIGGAIAFLAAGLLQAMYAVRP